MTEPIQGELFQLPPSGGTTRNLQAVRMAVEAAQATGRLSRSDAGLVAVLEATAMDLDRLSRAGKSVAFTAQVLLQLLQSAGLTPDLGIAPPDGPSDHDELATVLRLGNAARSDRPGTID